MPNCDIQSERGNRRHKRKRSSWGEREVDNVLMNIVISAVQCAVNISKSNFHPPTTTTRDFTQAQQVSTSALLIRHVKLVSLCQQLLLQFPFEAATAATVVFAVCCCCIFSP